MMKTMKLLTVLLLGVFSLQEIQAHALWVSTAHSGTKGVSHDVKVFFAEPGEKWEPLDGDEWKLVEGFELWLVKPNGEKSRLKLFPEDDHYAASFTPEVDGLYGVELKHEKVGVLTFEKMPPFIPYFYASAAIIVGKGSLAQLKKSDLPIQVVPQWNGSSKVDGFTIVIKDGGKGKAFVVTPNGAVKQLGEVASGTQTFEAKESGTYQVELSVQDKKGGSFEGKEYKAAFYTATTVFEIP
ncbi:hypothetical protein GCM10023231_15140 [Olivibacter ginsenosidimutans]|uniref:DUF4198 domain-containing protein n=1 Tax=Olivibacter ginsenosidimutans TaxID=1176537 RepID=A0ABP9AYH1_9SPHI